jgi:hypothetical protein
VIEGYKDKEKRMCKVETTKLESVEKEMCKLSMVIPHVVPSSVNTADPMISISYVLRVCVVTAKYFLSPFTISYSIRVIKLL